MKINNKKNNNDTYEYISLQDATLLCSYSQEYLSLRARQGKLKALKFGRNWVTKKEWLEEYSEKVEDYNHQANNKTEGLPPNNLPIEKWRLNLGSLRPAFMAALVLILMAAGGVFGKEDFLRTYNDIAEYAQRHVQNLTEKVGQGAFYYQNGLASVSDVVGDYGRWLKDNYSAADNFVSQQIVKIVDGYSAADNSVEKKASQVVQGAAVNFREGIKAVAKEGGEIKELAVGIWQGAKDTALNTRTNTKTKISDFASLTARQGFRVSDLIKGTYKFIVRPWTGGAPSVPSSELEELKTKMAELEKEPVVVKRIEVSKVVEPVKEITREIKEIRQLTKIDDTALADVRNQMAYLETEIGKRLYAPGGVISQTIYVTEPVSSPKIYQENGEIVLQTIGSGNVILTAATGLQLFGQQVVIRSTSLLTPWIYLASNTKIDGSLTAGVTNVSDLTAGTTNINGNLTIVGDLTLTGATTLTGNISITGTLSTTATTTLALSEGYVGIATTTPSYLFSVQGRSFFTATTTIASDLVVAGAMKNTATKIVAASDTPNKTARADYVADGTADQVEIQAAIDALPAGGGSVVLLEGTFNLSDTVTTTKSIKLTGQSTSTTIKMANSANANAITLAGSGDGITVEIGSIRFEGNKANNTSGRAIYNNGRVDPAFLHDLIIYDFAGDAIRLEKAVNWEISSSRIQSNGGWGVYMDGTGTNYAHWVEIDGVTMESNYGGVYVGGAEAYDLVLRGGFIASSNRQAILASSPAYNINILGSAFENNNQDNGDYPEIDIATTSNVVITDTRFPKNATGLDRLAIRVSNVNKGIISNNIFQNLTQGAITLDKSNKFSITGNTFQDNCQGTNNTYSAILLTDDGATYSTYNQITGNVIRETASNKCKYGIRENAAGDDYNLIGNNIVVGAVTADISSQGAHTTIAGNKTGVADEGLFNIETASGATSTALTVTQSGSGYGAIITGGNVGIGTTTPLAKLSVFGGSLTVNTDSTATTTISSGISTFAGGIISQASSTFEELNLTYGLSSATGSYSGLLTQTGGFIASASSTILGNFTVEGDATTTGNLAAGGNLYVYQNGNVGIGTSTPDALLSVGTSFGSDFQVNTAGAITAATLNTGQGANELYAMNQAVQTTDNVTFADLTLTYGLTSATGTYSGILRPNAGFISSASSTILGNFTVEGDATTTGNLASGGVFYIDQSNSYAGIGTTTMSGLFTVGTTTPAIAVNSAGNIILAELAGWIGIASSTPSDTFALQGDMQGVGNIVISGTLNTGQGSTEVYLMNQNVQTTSAVTFATIDTGQGANELYAMNQAVQTTDNVTFADLTLTYGLTSATGTFSGILRPNAGFISSASSTIEGNLTVGATSTTLFVEAGGNVGIGTAGPQEKLTLASASNFATEMAVPTSVSGATITGTLTATTWYIKLVASDGVGTTIGSSEYSSTTEAGQGIRVSWTAPTGASSYRVYIGTSSGGQDVYFIDDASSYDLTTTTVGQTSGTVPTVTTAYISKLTASGNSWFLGGNVGIGTTTPASKLDVFGGNLTVHTDSTATTTISSGISYFGNGIITNASSTIIGNFKVEGDATTTEDFAAGGVLFVQESGNVGIGTTNPSYLLSVIKSQNTTSRVYLENTNAGTAAENLFQAGNDTSSLLLYNSSSGYTPSGIRYAAGGAVEQNGVGGLSIAASNASGVLRFYTGGTTERVRIDTSGNVGIGDTNPSNLLTVTGGDISTNFGISAATGSFSGILRPNAGFISSASSTIIGNFTVEGDATTTEDFAAGGVLFVQESGNVGIGTTNPLNKLSVAGNIQFGDWTTAGSRYIGFARQDTGAFATIGASGIEIESGNFGGSGNYDQKLHFWTHTYNVGSDRRMTIDNYGNVGIGTTTPLAKLSVFGGSLTVNTDSTATTTISSGISTFAGGIISNASSTILGNFKVEGDATTTEDFAAGGVLFVQESGNVGIGTTGPTNLLVVTGADTALEVQNTADTANNEVAILGGGNRATPADNDNAYISFKLDNDAGNQIVFSELQWKATDVTNAESDGIVLFKTRRNNALVEVLSMGWDANSAGNINFNSTAQDVDYAFGISGNSSWMDIDSGLGQLTIAGNVGIGTTNPSNLLTVTGGDISTNFGISAATGSFSGILRPNAGFISSASSTIIGNFTVEGDATTTEDFAAGGVLFVQESGNVGIGTAGPGQELHVTGDVLINSGNWYYGRNAGATDQPLVRSRGMGYDQTTYPGLQVGQTNDHIALFIDPASITGGGFNGGVNEVMLPNNVRFLQANSGGTDWIYNSGAGTLVLNNGNVGIGTTTPASKLDVFGGNLTVHTDSTATTTISSGISTLAGGIISNASSTIIGNFSVEGDATTTEDFAAGGVLFVQESGNVGIGTTNPTAKLTVAGGIIGSSSSTFSGIFNLDSSDIHATSTDEINLAFTNRFRIATSTDANILTINSSGGVYLANSMYQPIYGSDDGLVLYLPFSEGMTSSSASKAYDRSPYGNDGTLTGFPMPEANATSGSGWSTTTCKAGSCMAFDGANDYMSIPNSASLNPAEITMEAWIYPRINHDGYHRLIDKGLSSASYGINSHAGNGFTPNFYGTIGGTVYTVTANASVPLNTWGHIAVTYQDGAGVKIYVNGLLDVTNTTPTGALLQTDTAPLYLSTNAGNVGASVANALFDEIRIYNRALSDDEIRTHYLRGTSAGGAVVADKFRVIGTDNNVDFIVSNGNVGIGTTTPDYMLDVAGTGRFKCASTWTDTGAYIECADIAELYSASENIESGDVVMIDSVEPLHVRKANNSNTMLGIVSTAPALVIRGSAIQLGSQPASSEIFIAGTQVPIALAGRVPVKVSLENGPIAVGDALTSASSTPGVAMKATKAGRVIGIALEPFNGEGIGKIMVFVNTHWQGNDLAVEENNSGQIVQIDIKLELALLGLVVNENGVLEVGTLKTQKLCVGSVCVTENEFMQVFGAGVGETLTSDVNATTSEVDASVYENGANRSCGSEVGVCQIGVQIYQDGVWGECMGSIEPSSEICDLVDNDCDGTIDEDDICGSPTSQISGNQEVGLPEIATSTEPVIEPETSTSTDSTATSTTP